MNTVQSTPRSTFVTIAALTIALLAVVFAGYLHAAAPAAGSTIGNQASATYTDASNNPHTATSNVVLTVVQQVASLTIDATQTRMVSPGGQVVFPHTLTNTGNGSDTFNLSLVQSTGDNFDLTNIAIYADANGDGLPDNSTAITSSGLIAAGAKFQFVVVGTVPANQTSTQNALTTVTATSTFTPARTASNVDTATVTSNGVVSVTQSISANSGSSPSGPYTITLTFNNTGNSTVTGLTLTDSLPTGFAYVAGSGKWSVSGNTALTDAAGGDPAGISYDWGVTQAGRMTAVVSTLSPGQSGTVSFQVSVPSGATPGTIVDDSSYNYNDGTGASAVFTTNTVQFTITQPPAVSIVGSTVTSVAQGGVVLMNNVVKNEGKGTETFALSFSNSNFPAGTTFTFVRSDGTTAILDSDGNGTVDTGPLAAGASFTAVLRAVLPPGTASGAFHVDVTATATSNPAISATATDNLSAISTSTVDLTANVAGTAGAGAGPGVSPIATENGDAGGTVRFTLNVKNTSTVADTYNLDASSLDTFAAGLPAGWTVVFRDANNAVITKTGLIDAGLNQVVYADVSIPAGQIPTTQAVYFRAKSATTGATDSLYDAVVVGSLRRLSLTANSAGQVFPGGITVYSHTLTNIGNVLEGDALSSSIALTTTDSVSGWSSVVYYDANGNGAIDANEVPVTDLSFVSNGGAGLTPGESVKLLVKVFAAAGSPIGTANTTTLTATTTNVAYATTVSAAVSVTDSSTVILSDLKLLKEQALDANGDGVADTAFTTGVVTTGAIPGACIRYRITVTNIGSQAAMNTVLKDTTPTFTSYHALVGAATNAGSVTSTPGNGAKGTLEFALGTIEPGASAVITFGVQIDQ